MSKYAIFSLCMLNKHYVVGACISGYTHKCFISRLNKKIDMVVMCDKAIYDEFKDVLELYYDRVELIDLDFFNISTKYNYAKEKYASWVSYSTNKWQCLKYSEYDKILFVDVDMLVANIDFYNIFDFNTPAILRCQMNPMVESKCNEKFVPNVGKSYLEYVTHHIIRWGGLDGGIVLLSPSKKLYNLYKNFTQEIFGTDGIYSSRNNFPDEASLFYFLRQQKYDLYTICRKYSVIPWDYPKEVSDSALLYNFNSFYKPWIKGIKIQWDDEKIWHYLYDAMPPNKKLKKLYDQSIINHYTDTFLKLDEKTRNKRYNINNIVLDKSTINTYDGEKKFGILNMSQLKKCLQPIVGGSESEIVDGSESDTFPYRNKFYTDDDRIRIFKNLIQTDLQLRVEKQKPHLNIQVPQPIFLYGGRYKYLIYQSSDYDKVQILSDLFNDNCRAACGFGSNPTPIQYYKDNKKNLENKIKKAGKPLTDYNMREEIYNSLPMECSIHNPCIIKYFIKKYKSKKVLDLSAGWGDRLLGAMAAGVNIYMGIDPNPCLHPNYQNMIKLLSKFSPNPSAKYLMIEDGSEKTTIMDNDFDLVYTSPPYFDYEKYTSDSRQSYLKYNTQDKWLEDFLKISILKAVNALRLGGRMVLYFSQEKGKTYMEKFLQWITSVPNIYHIGTIHYSDQKLRSPDPIFIYKKSDKIPKFLYNPKLQIDKISHNNLILNVFRDDYVVGGTKTRACVTLLQKVIKEKDIKQLIYSGASNGYAQVAIAYVLYLLKRSDIKLIFVFQELDDIETKKLRELSKYYHPNTQYTLIKGTMKDLYPIVDAYTAPTDYLIPFGFAFKEYKKILYKKLSKYLKPIKDKIKRLWLVVGSGTILYVLQKILPNTQFLGVQVGRTIKSEEVYDSDRLKLYVSSYKLYEKYNGKIPYNSLATYDGKVMEFIEKYAVSGDYVWNIAGIHQYML